MISHSPSPPQELIQRKSSFRPVTDRATGGCVIGAIAELVVHTIDPISGRPSTIGATGTEHGNTLIGTQRKSIRACSSTFNVLLNTSEVSGGKCFHHGRHERRPLVCRGDALYPSEKATNRLRPFSKVTSRAARNQIAYCVSFSVVHPINTVRQTTSEDFRIGAHTGERPAVVAVFLEKHLGFFLRDVKGNSTFPSVLLVPLKKSVLEGPSFGKAGFFISQTPTATRHFLFEGLSADYGFVTAITPAPVTPPWFSGTAHTPRDLQPFKPRSFRDLSFRPFLFTNAPATHRFSRPKGTKVHDSCVAAVTATDIRGLSATRRKCPNYRPLYSETPKTLTYNIRKSGAATTLRPLEISSPDPMLFPAIT